MVCNIYWLYMEVKVMVYGWLMTLLNTGCTKY